MRLFPENLPFKDSPSWTLWKKGIRDGKPAKVPYQPNGQRAKSNDSSTWMRFDAVFLAFQDIGGYDGICWMMPATPGDVVFIDIDHCIKDGKIEPWAQKIVDEFASYTETSQSETGLHIIIEGKKPGARCRRFDLPFEIYDHLRPCYLTGDTLEGHTAIEARQEPLDRLYNELFPEANEPQQKVRPPGSSLSDEAIIARMLGSANANEIESLLKGDTSAHGGDESAADLALCNHLAFFCGKDAAQMDRIFRTSKLMRPKWDEKRGRLTYGEMTIEKAISGTRECYEPPKDEPIPTAKCSSPGPDYSGHDLDGQLWVEGGNQAQPFVKGMSQEEFEKFHLESGPKFSFNLPADHFLNQFVGYGTAISDAYPVYWFMSGLFMLGTVADKKLMFHTSADDFYANIWAYILGNSSLARKTTVVKKSNKMMEKALGFAYIHARIPNTFSPEAFVEHMDTYNHAAWVRDEAAGVLSLMQKDYMRGFKDDLMQLYDCGRIDRMLRTKKGGEKSRFEVNDPYLNVLFASTGAALGYNMNLIDKETGFLVRFIFAFPQDEKETYMPLDTGTAKHSELEEICTSRLTTIAARIANLPECVTMVHDQDARAYYNAWQELREKEAAKLNDGYSSQIFSRLNPSVIKFAMLFELGSSDFDPNRPIREEYFVEACRLVDEYFAPTARDVYDLIGSANKENHIERIVLYLTRHNGKATKKEIMRDVKIKSKEMTDYINTMLECDMVEYRNVFNEKTGRNTAYLFLLDNSKVANVGKVERVGKVGKVENSNEENNDEEDSTKITLDTLPTLPTLSTFHEEPQKPIVEEIDRIRAGHQKYVAKKKRTCCLCGRSFPYDLTPYYANGESGYICSTCHMHGPPQEAKEPDPVSQVSLNESVGRVIRTENATMQA